MHGFIGQCYWGPAAPLQCNPQSRALLPARPHDRLPAFLGAGACKADLVSICPSIEPGAARLAACLAQQDLAVALDDSLPPLSKACQAELDAFRQDAASNVNKNVPIGGWAGRRLGT